VKPPWKAVPAPEPDAESEGENSEGNDHVAEERVEMGRRPRRGRYSTGALFRPPKKRVHRPLWGDSERSEGHRRAAAEEDD
jgi:hypothetical protein